MIFCGLFARRHSLCRCMHMEKVTVSRADDVAAFWVSHDHVLADAIMRYLYFSITAAYIEHTVWQVSLMPKTGKK